MISALARKWGQTMAISWSNHLAYKLNFFLLVIGPTLVFYFIRKSLWDAIYGLDSVTLIQGYDRHTMLTYQAWVLIVTLLTQGHTSMKLSEDIRLGRISAYLIYPFTLWQFQFCSFLAFQGIQFFVATITIAVLNVLGLIDLPPIPTALIGLCYCSLVSIFWFGVQYIIGLLSFWLEETWVLRVLVSIVATFLSGTVVPLELYPDWLQALLLYTPFPYITHVPVKLMMADMAIDLAEALAIIGFWAAAVSIFAQLVWRRGLRLYAAAGM